MIRYALPLAVFVLMVGLLGYGLKLDPKKVPSPLIDKAAPEFSLAMLHDSSRSLSTADMRGQVWVLNVWASWCVSCRAEHEVVTALANKNLVTVVGLNYKDKSEDAIRWLQQFGDPYATSVVDFNGKVGIDWGVYGVPETFVIGADGLIKYKHIGPMTMESLEQKVMPVIRELLS
ncbi:MAG: DsbE family thiol:disulfide interchange protein [Gammaproteobacteria bacterium]|nr:MAG: DsbE family thiol:disulfide interchange protein [Gammaproteobacteria bacterium]UCH41544.1 MAG: DsbE family thiol:disulfide interchange protein [Gammaproteobacteria bacterium]